MEKRKGNLVLPVGSNGGRRICAGGGAAGRRTADGGRRSELSWRLGRGRTERGGMSEQSDWILSRSRQRPLYVPCRKEFSRRVGLRTRPAKFWVYYQTRPNFGGQKQFSHVPRECFQDMELSRVNLMGLEFDSAKEYYHLKILDKNQSDSTISCKCTVQEGGKLAIHKVELNQIRQLVEDISCLSQDLDLRLMLSTKKNLKNINPEVKNAIDSLVSSAILDPDVKGGLRWPFGKESIDGRFTIVGVWHTNYKAFGNKTLKLYLRHADRFDHQSSTGEVSNEVTFKLTGISKRLQDGSKEADSVKEMLESAVRMIWDSALCYKMAR
ncbi:uncharacterized protein [Lolium perenne]|uniref:uncharacterized protein isoform X3 n=1 Tax=Lolium perenne TaxID=4522 RepID=UPI0021F52E4C|nr:uncharacterized protein LOC127316529 isoform X2 [Lolium perenne]